MPHQLRLFDPSEPPRSPGEVRVARGALAAEGMLLARLDELAAEARKNPAVLAKPVRIVVPSRSLRLHLGNAIVRHRGRSVAGVTIQTLHAVAFEVLERAGEPAPSGMPLFDVVAQRLARKERILRQGLGDLVDGYAAVAGTVRDLLDAGFEPALFDAVDEALAAEGPRAAGKDEIERARALVRVAARTEAVMREIGLGRVSTLLRRAVELIAADPERALPSRAILIHGFSDATGVATDLLQALLRRGALLILDQPPDPAGGSGAERAFTARFTERLGSVARFVPAPPAAQDAAQSLVQRFDAVGAEAEAREVARRVRELLDAGARPEGIGIVGRDLAPYALHLARHFRRLGVPFSGVAARGGLEPAGRRARAMLDLLRRGDEAPADRWLDALGSRTSLRGGRLVDLRLAFYSLGAGRLRDVAELVIDPFLKDGSYPLPIRQGLRQAVAEEKGENVGDLGDAGEVEDSPREAYAPRRRVDGTHLRAAVGAAGKLRGRLGDWPDEARAGEHLRRLRSLLMKDLGWEPGSGPLSSNTAPVLKALAELEEDIPAEFPLTREELQTLLARALDGVGAAALGGHGGGVQVLTVTEARGRTFEHLFIPGLNRDVFPRGVREDPLLSDELRQVLQRVLPDVPIKRAGFDEERYLYAQLLAASPRVTLSWQAADADGKPRSPSPLLRGLGAEDKAPALYPRTPGPSSLRPADEHAVIAALHSPRPVFGAVLATALEEARTELLGEEVSGASNLRPADLAAVRVAILDELDPDLRTPEGRAVRARLGPYFGFVGPLVAAGEGADPRRMDLSVTHLETLAGCPWQLFLGRLLQLEPTPDPLAALPGADPLLLGNTVHRVLERIAGGSDPGPLASWPAVPDLDALMLDMAAQTLAAEGILLPGLARALAERARPYVDAAGAADWAEDGLSVLRAESKEEVEVSDAEGRSRPLRFRADRVDRSGGFEGALRFTDYKTGRPPDAIKPDARRRHFLNRVRSGTFLQAVAYLLAARGEPALGRYLYLRPEAAERELAVASGDRDFTDAFDRAVRAVLSAWDAGSFFPRTVDPSGRKEPARCGYCQVSEACLRGDSGARNRLFEWTETARTEETALAAPEQSLLAVWRLPAKEKEAAATILENGNGGDEA